jgi:hypothetical protein
VSIDLSLAIGNTEDQFEFSEVYFVILNVVL